MTENTSYRVLQSNFVTSKSLFCEFLISVQMSKNVIDIYKRSTIMIQIIITSKLQMSKLIFILNYRCMEFVIDVVKIDLNVEIKLHKCIYIFQSVLDPGKGKLVGQKRLGLLGYEVRLGIFCGRVVFGGIYPPRKTQLNLITHRNNP